ncbi:hypothetical protein [Fontivita pretiosa]|jgi:hypothetical protein
MPDSLSDANHFEWPVPGPKRAIEAILELDLQNWLIHVLPPHGGLL